MEPTPVWSKANAELEWTKSQPGKARLPRQRWVFTYASFELATMTTTPMSTMIKPTTNTAYWAIASP